MRTFSLLYLLALCTVSLTSCHSVDESDINLEWNFKDSYKHIGNGLWMKVPSSFAKAKSYNGFQAPNYESSFSM